MFRNFRKFPICFVDRRISAYRMLFSVRPLFANFFFISMEHKTSSDCQRQNINYSVAAEKKRCLFLHATVFCFFSLTHNIANSFDLFYCWLRAAGLVACMHETWIILWGTSNHWKYVKSCKKRENGTNQLRKKNQFAQFRLNVRHSVRSKLRWHEWTGLGIFVAIFTKRIRRQIDFKLLSKHRSLEQLFHIGFHQNDMPKHTNNFRAKANVLFVADLSFFVSFFSYFFPSTKYSFGFAHFLYLLQSGMRSKELTQRAT